MKAKVTVVLPTYNSRKFLEQCLPPLLEMDYPNYDILVVDDCSTDGTVEYLEQYYPQIQVIPLQCQSGHSKACNTGILATDVRFIYIVEHHTIVTKDTLSRLMEVMVSDDRAAICYSKQINVYQESFAIVEGKRYAHYVVNQQCDRRPLDEERADEHEEPVDVTSAGTFSYLIDKEHFCSIGFFDEEYFIYISDYELTLRAKATGLKCYYVPASLSYHKSFVETASDYNFRGGKAYPASRTFFISRNRWLLMLSYYSMKTLVLLGPALLIYELALIGFVIHRRVLRSYMKAVLWLLSHPGSILKKRHRIQQLKQVHDKDLLVAGELNFVPGLTQSVLGRTVIRALTGFLTWYWKVARVFL